MGTRGRLTGAVLCSGLYACSVEPYACSSDRQCFRGGLQGVCELQGFCAYADSECASGRRFSINAVDHLADQCVRSDELGSSSTGEASTDSSSSGGAEPMCGDGRLDPGEDCDDANLQEGDGCTPECRISGAERWIQRHAGPALADERAVALHVRDDGVVVVAGEQGEDEGLRSALVLAYQPDGSMAVPPWVVEPPDERRLQGLASDGVSVMVVGEQPSAGPAGDRAWYARLGPTLEPEQLGAIDTLVSETGHGAAYTSQGFVVIGQQDGRAWARWVDGEQPDWRGEALVSIDVVAARGDGAFLIVGATARDPVRWWLVSPQGVPLAQGSADAESVRAADFDTAGRPLLGGVQAGEPWVAAFELGGGLAWSLIVDLGSPGGSVEALDGVVDGDFYAAGVDGSGVQGWVGRFDIDGQVRWSGRVLDQAGELGLHAVRHDHRNDVLYVSGTERSAAGDLDLLVAALEP